jgi:predicted  nucleic acid-binding Zn-ribbon protein
MKYRKLCFSIFLSAVVMTGLAAAQQPAKVKRPVKNPPQFPNIIDLENKDGRQTDRQTDQQENAPVADAGGQPDSLAVAVQSLANELRALGQELRSLNIRGQAQIEMLRMTRTDMKIDYYERELRPVRERLATLESDEQLLRQMMTREGLLAQTASTPTMNREELMKQIRMQHEARYRAVQSEQERLRKLEADLTASLKIYQNISRESEQKIQEAEDALKNIESGSQGVKRQ